MAWVAGMSPSPLVLNPAGQCSWICIAPANSVIDHYAAAPWQGLYPPPMSTPVGGYGSENSALRLRGGALMRHRPSKKGKDQGKRNGDEKWNMWQYWSYEQAVTSSARTLSAAKKAALLEFLGQFTAKARGSLPQAKRVLLLDPSRFVAWLVLAPLRLLVDVMRVVAVLLVTARDAILGFTPRAKQLARLGIRVVAWSSIFNALAFFGLGKAHLLPGRHQYYYNRFASYSSTVMAAASNLRFSPGLWLGTDRALTRAFREFARTNHPDKMGGTIGGAAPTASELFHQVAAGVKLIKTTPALRPVWVIFYPVLTTGPLGVIVTLYTCLCLVAAKWRPRMVF
ncbi:unnamed protein product [Chrysoparadoxa australica]